MASAFFSAVFISARRPVPEFGLRVFKKRACGAFSLIKYTVKNISAPAAPPRFFH